MTVSETALPIEKDGNGAATVFSFSPLKIFDETELEVVFRDTDDSLTTLTLGTGPTNYSVQADFPGDRSVTGSIIYPADQVTPIVAGTKLFIKPNLPFTQELALENQGGYLPALQEGAFDRAVLLLSQIKEELFRAVKAPLGGTETGDTLLAAIEADVATTAANAALTEADVITTGNNVATTNADVVLTGLDVTYAAEWANKAEDSLVSAAAGGDEVGDYSALHWAKKAETSVADVANMPQNATGFEDPDSAGITLNVDISKIDVDAAEYFVHGIRYSYAGGTAISPTIGAGDTSTWVGLDSSETLQYQGTKFSDAQLETILPLGRLQSVGGQSGPGSDLLSPIDLRYNIGEEGWVQRIWLRDTLGALFPADGIDGLITENSGTPLQVDQTSGKMFDAQRKPITITGDTNISARALYHIGGTWTLQSEATIVTPLFYDDGTDIVALPVGKWAAHTLLRAPKDEDSFTLIYSQQQFNSQAEAEAAGADFGLFASQAVSTFVPVANLIVKGNSTAIESIIDLRPKVTTVAGNVIGTATLQQIYDNSVTPEFLTDTVRGGITIKRGSAADTDNILEGLNGAGGTTFSVTGEGNAVGKNIKLAKLDAITAPTTNDDSGDGYEVGSIWIDVTGNNTYMCVDDTVAAAIWNELDAAAAADPFTASATISSTADWETLTTAGLYKTSGTTYENAPLYNNATVGFLVVRAIDGDTSRIQEWYEIDSGDKWVRSYDGTNWTQWVCNSVNPKNVIQQFTDLLDNSITLPYMETYTSGTGAAVTQLNLPGLSAVGIAEISSGTTTTGKAGLGFLQHVNYPTSFSLFQRFEYRVAIKGNLSDGTNGFQTLIGVIAITADIRTSNNIILFSQEDSENSGNWVCVTDDTGTETVTNTAVAPTADVFQDFRVEINRDQTEVKFYIDDVLVATHTTNITLLNTTSAPAVKIVKTSGGTARVLQVDKMFKQLERG